MIVHGKRNINQNRNWFNVKFFVESSSFVLLQLRYKILFFKKKPRSRTAKRFAHAISVHYQDFEHAYIYWIWLRSFGSYVIIISMNNHLCKCLCVSSKAYIIGIKKKTTHNLKGELFDTILFYAYHEKTNSYIKTSPQSQQIEFHFIITNQLLNMWPLFNRAHLLAYIIFWQ